MVLKLMANGSLPPTGPEVFNSDLHTQSPFVVAEQARRQTVEYLSQVEAAGSVREAERR